MKSCKCGNQLATGAEICPKCGRRFTTPATLIIGSIIFIALLLFFGVMYGFLRRG